MVVPPKYKPLVTIGKNIIDQFADNDFSLSKMKDHVKDSIVGGLTNAKIFQDHKNFANLFKKFDLKNIFN